MSTPKRARELPQMASAGLDYITIRGFRSIASIEKVPIRAINVLIGANGSGKSNFIGAFAFLHAIREGRLQEYVARAGGAEQILHYGAKNTKEILLHVSFGSEVNQYRIALAPTADDSLAPISEMAYFWNRAHPRPWHESLPSREGGREAGISAPTAKSTASWVQMRLSRWRLYHVHDTSQNSPMRRTAQLNDNGFLRPDGSNLPAFLYLLQQKYETAYRLIRNAIQRVAPFFDDFVLAPDRLNTETIRLAWKHRRSDQYFGASAFSDGTLRFILLTILFLQPSELRPTTILVDEPELGLHPFAMEVLASLVKQASTETQVILSTQSAILLDHFEPEDVMVAERVEDATQIRRLDSEPLKEWLEDYSLGQLWEKNELGGRPRG